MPAAADPRFQELVKKCRALDEGSARIITRLIQKAAAKGIGGDELQLTSRLHAAAALSTEDYLEVTRAQIAVREEKKATPPASPPRHTRTPE